MSAVRVSLLAPDADAPDPGSPRCITEGCGKERAWKGLCRSCYGQARQLIDSGKVSGWDELEQLGLIIQDDKPFVAAWKRKKTAALPAPPADAGAATTEEPSCAT